MDQEKSVACWCEAVVGKCSNCLPFAGAQAPASPLTKRQQWAQERALVLMEAFGLGHWSFRFIDEVGVAGFARCDHPFKPGVIELGRYVPDLNPNDLVEDTIRHEIAHGLAYLTAGETGHGPAWTEACKLTGAIAKPTTSRVSTNPLRPRSSSGTEAGQAG